MRRKVFCLIVLTACALAAVVDIASAQRKCTEGRALDGSCVRPDLAQSMRQSAIVFAQPKISQQAFPILPIEDWFYRYPNQLIPDPSKPAPAFLKSP
jgi:hypothetical protein